MAKRYFWLKLQDTFFDEKHIKALRRLPDGDALVIVYLKMMLKALKTDGVLSYDRILPDAAEEIALFLDENINIVKLTISALESFGAIERLDNDSLYISEVTRLIGSESSSAERVRNHRAQLVNNGSKALHCNADVTGCNTYRAQCNVEKRREEKRREDIEIEKENIKRTSAPDIPTLISGSQLSEELKAALLSWVQDKKERRQPYKPTGAKALITQTANNAARYGEDAVINLIAESMANRWQGIAWDKLKEGGRGDRLSVCDEWYKERADSENPF